MDNLPTLNKHPDLVADSTNHRSDWHAVGVLLHSIAYAGVQAPLNAVVQPFGGRKDALLDAPEQTKPWTLDWNLQQVGTGIGMLLPILASRKAVTSVLPSATAELAAGKGLAALTSSELANLSRYELGVSVGTGLVYGGFLTPTNKLEPGQSLLDARLRQAASAGMTFGTLNLTGLGLKSLGQSSYLKGSTLAKVLGNDTAVMALSGVPAAVVSVDSQSVLNGKGLPSIKDHLNAKYAEAIYNFSVVGAGLGYLTGPRATAERDPAKLGLERAASDNALANKTSVELLRDLNTRLEGPSRVPDLNLESVKAPSNISYERDVVDLPRLKDAAFDADVSASLGDFEANHIEHVPTPVRVYQAEGTPLRVVVPEEYAARLDRFEELSKQADGTGPAAENAKAELDQPQNQELIGRMTVQDAFRHALMTPEPGKFKEIRLSGDSNPYDPWYRARNGNNDFESAGDTVFKSGTTTWYKKQSGPVLAEDTAHEWSHLFDEEHPLDAQIIHIANRIDNLDTRTYAGVPRERLAILLGEYALHPSGQRVGQLMQAAPVTARAIGDGLSNLLSRMPESQRGPLHDQFVARAELMRGETDPVARQTLIEKIQADPNSPDGQNALTALLFLGKPHDMQGLTAVTSAQLGFEPVADSQGAMLGQLPNLKHADLSNTFIGPNTMRQIGGKAMESLNLSGTKVTNATMSLLGQSLKSLDISGTKIGDQALPYLMRLQSLESLDVSGTMISASGMQRLQAALPNTKIQD